MAASLPSYQVRHHDNAPMKKSKAAVLSDHDERDRDEDGDEIEVSALPSSATTANGTSTTQGRPPTKRARKAINCVPCRTSKLKCDKARPCSSCVLRGTASHCYADGREEGGAPRNGIDPHNEIARMRQALASLESYVIRGSRARAPPSLSSASIMSPGASAGPAVSMSAIKGRRAQDGTRIKPDPGLEEDDDDDEERAPGMLAEKDRGGLYAGPTSTATLLFSLKTNARDGSEEDPKTDRRAALNLPTTDDIDGEGGLMETDVSSGADDDLLAQLPAIATIDVLVGHYTSFCNWMYRHVHPPSLLRAWRRFKEQARAGRVTLATLACVMAVAVRYLPEDDPLLRSGALGTGTGSGPAAAGATREEVGERFYAVACEALARYRAESRGALSIELVELLLVRTHYLTLTKSESEAIWAIRGELVCAGTALGLHRDPGRFAGHAYKGGHGSSSKAKGMSRETAERRRWAWWHIILLERWQCFLFGRPLAIAAHHFDTRLPSAALTDPQLDPSGRSFQANICMFRLADILGDIVDDAVSIQPVPYEQVQARDRELLAWYEELPRELDLDEYRLARALASEEPTDMRLGVLSVILRTSYFHIRFTLHRPYAAAAHDAVVPSSTHAGHGHGQKQHKAALEAEARAQAEHRSRMAQSLDTAASAADKLVSLVAQAQPETIAAAQDGHAQQQQYSMHRYNSAHQQQQQHQRAPAASRALAAHVHWGPFHCFSAAMFFSLQLIADSAQPGAALFRANIHRVRMMLRQACAPSGGGQTHVAEKAMRILEALRPLYESDVTDADGSEEKEKSAEGGTATKDPKERARLIALVRSLAFPYHDAFATRPPSYGRALGNGMGYSNGNESPRSTSSYASGTTGVGTGMNGANAGAGNYSPGAAQMAGYGGAYVATSSTTTTTSGQQNHSQQTRRSVGSAPILAPALGRSGSTPAPPYSPHGEAYASHAGVSTGAGVIQNAYAVPSLASSNTTRPDMDMELDLMSVGGLARTASAPSIAPSCGPAGGCASAGTGAGVNVNTHASAPAGAGMEDPAMWGASVGFAQGEWARFLDVMQRGNSGDSAGSAGGLLGV